MGGSQRLLSANGHNCYTWAKEQLTTIGIELEATVASQSSIASSRLASSSSAQIPIPLLEAPPAAASIHPAPPAVLGSAELISLSGSPAHPSQKLPDSDNKNSDPNIKTVPDPSININRTRSNS